MLAGEDVTAKDVIVRSIAYHDPNGFWDRGEIHLEVNTVYSEIYAERVGQSQAGGKLVLSPAHQVFRYTKTTGDDVVEYELAGNESRVVVNGSSVVSEEDRTRLRVRDPELYRDYFEYLFGMPMKLRDPGTNVDPRVHTGRFNGRDTLRLRVTYDPQVGDDIWDFFFDPVSYALVGYRFFHDESKNDGEYIVFDGELRETDSGMRFPRTMSWHFNADDGHLATDEIISVSTRTP